MTKEPQQPKEQKPSERIEELSGQVAEDIGLPPSKDTVMIAAILRYLDERAQKDNPPATPSKEDTECTCKWRTADGKRHPYLNQDCPIHGEPKQESLDEILEKANREGWFDLSASFKKAIRAWHTQKLRELREALKTTEVYYYSGEEKGWVTECLPDNLIIEVFDRAIKETK